MKKKKNIKTCIQVVCSLINDLGLYTHEVTLVIMDFIRHLTFHIYIWRAIYYMHTIHMFFLMYIFCEKVCNHFFTTAIFLFLFSIDSLFMYIMKLYFYMFRFWMIFEIFCKFNSTLVVTINNSQQMWNISQVRHDSFQPYGFFCN